MSKELASLTLGDAGAALLLNAPRPDPLGSPSPASPRSPTIAACVAYRRATNPINIDHVITHQTSARAIRKGMAKMAASFGDSPRHDAVITVDRYGNTASTTHTVALVEELEAGHIQAGETVALIALASGLEIGIVLLTMDEELVDRYGHAD